MRHSLGQEPWWNAGRRAAPSAGAAPQPARLRWLRNSDLTAFRFLFFFPFVIASAAKQSSAQCEIALDCFVAIAPRNDGQSPTVMHPAHPPPDCSDEGLGAATFLALLAHNSGANKKRVARTIVLVSPRPACGERSSARSAAREGALPRF